MEETIQKNAMALNDLSSSEIRTACRFFFPESKGATGFSQTETKAQIIARFEAKNITFEQVVQYLQEKKAMEAKKQQEQQEKQEQQQEYKGFEAVNEAIVKHDEEAKKQEAKEDAASKKLALLQEIFGRNELDEDAVKKIVGEMLDKHDEGISEAIANVHQATLDSVNEILDGQAVKTTQVVTEMFAKLQGQQVKKIEIKLQSGEYKSLGTCHYLTEKVAKIASIQGVNLMLVGPAGSGKTTCCEKVAEILGLKFHAMSCGPEMVDSKMLGFIDANGNYHTTQIREAFEKGGLLLLDELDAANAASLTILNALLSNGYCAFPDGMVKRHENFRCICAANTYGRGADRLYVGRCQLDAATLDRFAVIDFDYDENMERTLAGNDEWTSRVQALRKSAFALKQRVVITPRASINGAKLLKAGFTMDEVEEMMVWKGIAGDIKEKIVQNAK